MPQLTRANLAALIVILGVLAIVSTSYTNLNGDHIWRQSDMYSQILGMLGQRGLEPLGHFTTGRSCMKSPSTRRSQPAFHGN
jgi:hypothetical protein